jgi:nitroreductase
VKEFFFDISTAYRKDGKDMLFCGAPHLLIVSPGEKTTCVYEDVALSLAYFELLAQSAGLGTTWCGLLKSVADIIPEVRNLLALAPDAHFYAMMFGKPAVKYARTVQRDSTARIRRIDIQ